MAGDPAQLLQVGEYELHFCSEDCRDGFRQDPTAALLAMEIPEHEATETTP